MAAKSKRTRPKKSISSPKTFHPDAAGIDLGATVHYVAVPAGSDPRPVRNFGTQTADLNTLADWLKECSITTVAMEATGVYWIPLSQILEDRGFEVRLVNARHVKNVPGRKSDVQDCQWLQYLHSVGLLNGSFRPAAAICAVRSLLRHRESLMRSGCQYLLRVQKALDQMNVQLHHAVSDITGLTGLAILDAIVAGERSPAALARLRHYRCQKSELEIAKALEGDWREEHLFTLRQSLEAWRFHQRLMEECDQQIAGHMDALEDQEDVTAQPPSKAHAKQADEPMRQQLVAKFGVDLTEVEGISLQTALVFLGEVEPPPSHADRCLVGGRAPKGKPFQSDPCVRFSRSEVFGVGRALFPTRSMGTNVSLRPSRSPATSNRRVGFHGVIPMATSCRPWSITRKTKSRTTSPDPSWLNLNRKRWMGLTCNHAKGFWCQARCALNIRNSQ